MSPLLDFKQQNEKIMSEIVKFFLGFLLLSTAFYLVDRLLVSLPSSALYFTLGVLTGVAFSRLAASREREVV